MLYIFQLLLFLFLDNYNLFFITTAFSFYIIALINLYIRVILKALTIGCTVILL